MIDEPVEKRRRILYCPDCNSDMINLFELIEHAAISKCGMTLERLEAVGVLNANEVEEIRKNVDQSKILVR